MGKHSQRPISSLMVCANCKLGVCEKCVDVLRAVYTDEMICQCKRRNHSGEAVEKQVVDPFTGTVHAPGLTVTVDGEVKRNDDV